VEVFPFHFVRTEYLPRPKVIHLHRKDKKRQGK